MKREILKTSLKQFLEFGIREMSIQKLIEPLGISTKTVYKYFENKEQLLEEVLLVYYDQQFELLRDLTAKRNTIQLLVDVWYVAVEREHQVNSAFYYDLQYYYPELKQKVEIAVSKKFTEQFIRIIQTGISEGLFLKNIEPAVVMQGIYVFFTGITRENRFKDFKVPPLTLLKNTLGLYIRGMCTGKGILKFDEYIKSLKPFGSSVSKKRNAKLAKQL